MIQGSAAETVKIASVLFYDWILEHGCFNVVKISGFIHDEILIECPKNNATIVADKLQECMEKAGTYYCPIVPLKAVPEIASYWTH